MSNRVNPDSWRRIGAVLDRLSDVDLRLDPVAVAEACQAEGISPEEIQPYLDGARRAVTLPEELDPAVLDAAVRALAVESTGRSLVEGERLGPYEVVARLGSGGMGDVYEARDTRLGRPVALKLVRADLAARPDGRLRFEREARAISTLNHPHICTLHDVGEHDGVGFLVMELVEGETLDVRLQRRPLPLPDALEYGVQIAEALAAAQRVGIIHRDLKPANIMITPHGVKVLDFGLATLQPERGPVPGATKDGRLTAEGTILGTLQYMAPEQLQGKAVDARADIFSLGAILYEMVSGRKAFDADSSAGLVAAVLEREPAPIGTIRHDAPASLDWVIGQCLAKDPGRRWEHAGDLARQLRWLSESRPPATGRLHRFPQRRVIVRAVAVLLVLAAGAGAVVYLTGGRERQFSNVGLLRFAIPPPDGTRFEQLFALSPDGGRLAFTAIDERGVPALWIRPLDALNAQRIGGTDGAFFPFWSPDGRSLGFFANSALKRVDLETGNVRTICQAGFGGGGSWNRDDVIVFAANSGASSTPQQQVLLRVSASGGTPRPVTRVKGGFGNHAWPHFLPDGQHYLYMRSEAGEWAGVHLGRLDSEWEKPIHVVQKMAEVSGETDVARLALENATNSGRRATAGGPNTRAVYAAGHLFFLRDRALVGQPFDISRLELTGEPVRIADAVALDAPGRSAFDVSPNGILAYRAPATPAASELTWFDRAGRTLGRVGDVGAYRFAALSPDGRSVLATRRESGLQTGGIVRIEIASGTEIAVGQRGSFPNLESRRYAVRLPECRVSGRVRCPDGWEQSGG